jgi:hypothetical protein
MALSAILDPTGSAHIRGGSARAVRLAGLDGTTVALIDNGKPNADLLLSAIEARLRTAGVVDARIFTKDFVGVPVDQTTIDQIRETCDFAIAALGDCGSCSAGTAQDSLVLERAGVPAVSICTQPFGVTARAMAASYGAPEFDVVLTRHPVASLSASEIEQRAEGIVAEILAVIVGTTRAAA